MSNRAQRLLALLDRVAELRVLVVGDVMLDEYLVGAPARVSREAPVLVLELARRMVRPGGGANPAVNLRALGVATRMLGVVGRDAAGRELRANLRRAGIDPSNLITAPGAPTTLKTRVIAETGTTGSQQVVRVDRAARELPAAAEAALLDAIARISATVNALLLSDYKGGVISPAVILAAREAAAANGCLLSVDSQGDLGRFERFDLVKCNLPDAEASLGRSFSTERDFRDVGQSLVRELGLGCLMITRGAEGLSVSTADGRYARLPVINRTEVFDVTGAGDTAVAVATAITAIGADPIDAAYLANIAAGEVVKRLGVVTTSVPELRRLLVNL